MNKVYKLQPIILLLLLTFSSCSNWFDITSKSEVGVDEMFETAEGYYNSATGVYINMGNSSLYGGYLSLSALEPLTARYGVSDRNESRIAWSEYDYTTSGSLDMIHSIWLKMYNNIFNANLVIDKLRAEKRQLFEPDVREIMLGEMLALRAYMYFDLVRMFNDSYVVNPDSDNVPYKTTWDATIGERIPSSELLNSIIADLEEAQEYLRESDPIVTSRNIDDSYISYDRNRRMNYYAVSALIARVSLYKGDYEEAYDNAKLVIDANKFRFITADEIAIYDDYGNELYSDRIFTPELIFALEGSEILSTSKKLYEALHQDHVKSEDIYLSGDIRLEAWLYANNSANGKINMIKYQRSSDADAAAEYAKPATPMLKLSELYLIIEESILNVPSLDSAPLSYINTLKRNRNTAELGVGTDAEGLKQEIIDEYIRDFIGEGQIFFNYKRLNLLEVDNGMSEGNMLTLPEDAYVLPRPEDENDFGN